VIGFVGRLEEAKGLRILVRAAADLALAGDVEVRLAGTGPLRPALEALARDLGIAERVVFVGQVHSTAMPALYRSFDVLVLPSLTTPRWKEQFGRALAEAMLCEVPTIGSDSGEIPHVIGDAGLIVPEGDSAALATALHRLAGDVALRRALAAAGRQRAIERFTMKAVAQHTWALYRKVLKQ
jgi:glycosyltransferase involved in cell wall biosynthesis